MGVKPLDHRPHKQGGDHGSCADGDMAEQTGEDADGIAGDSAQAECGDFLFICGDQRPGVVSRHAQVRGKIDGGGETGS